MVGKLLGYAEIATTERYAHLADDPLREWGYYTVESGRREQSEWQAATFGEADIRVQAIRAIDDL